MRVNDKISKAIGAVMGVAVLFVLVVAVWIFVAFEDVQILGLVLVAGFGILLLAIIGAMGSKLKREVAEPVSELAQFAQKMVSGNADAMGQNIPQGELAEFAESLNKMHADIIELKNYVGELSKRTVALSAPKGLGKNIFQVADGIAKLAKENEAVFADFAAIADKLATGDLITAARFRGSTEHSKTIEALAKTLNSFQSEVATLALAMADGNFKNTINEDSYTGSWQKTAENLNAASKAVDTSIGAVGDGLTKLAQGHFNEPVPLRAKGEFAKLASSFNNSITALDKIISMIAVDIESVSKKKSLRGNYPVDLAKVRDSLDAALREIEAMATAPQPALNNAVSVNSRVPSRSSDGNRMSGAKKTIDPARVVKNPDFMRSDYGKY